MLRNIFNFLSSLRLTIVSLGAAIVLVFFGTIAQVNLGGHDVQTRFFQSLIIMWPLGSQGWSIPVFPGGHLIGAILLINLIAAHLRRFRWTRHKLGIQLIHGGLIIMLAGGLFTDLFATESFMRLAPGETRDYSEDGRTMELAVIDQSNNKYDQVTSIPDVKLKTGEAIEHESLPFRILVHQFYQNSRLTPSSKANEVGQSPANRGEGRLFSVEALPHATAENKRDSESAIIEILPLQQTDSKDNPALGCWLVSDQISQPQTFTYGGKNWSIALRLKRYYMPYTLMLQKFTHEHFPGTEIAKNFTSTVTLIDPSQKEDRQVLIYMNHPLRYRGNTYFQSGFEPDDTATILEVVHNPVFVAPYLACIVIAAGLLLQFGSHLYTFSRRRNLLTAS